MSAKKTGLWHGLLTMPPIAHSGAGNLTIVRARTLSESEFSEAGRQPAIKIHLFRCGIRFIITMVQVPGRQAFFRPVGERCELNGRVGMNGETLATWAA